MPTRHARIAVVADPELNAALDRAAVALGTKHSRATLLRELALVGAASLPDDDTVRLRARLAERHGVRPARLGTCLLYTSPSPRDS